MMVDLCGRHSLVDDSLCAAEFRPGFGLAGTRSHVYDYLLFGLFYYIALSVFWLELGY